ncbi:hypothetical protein, partial [Salmonella sp. SAL4355]|uniref:hypothetical protein n=1 Tax=Salmonella sp. SAL4355 TaxID=3159876 RepID=UPI00397AB7E2
PLRSRAVFNPQQDVQVQGFSSLLFDSAIIRVYASEQAPIISSNPKYFMQQSIDSEVKKSCSPDRISSDS